MDGNIDMIAMRISELSRTSPSAKLSSRLCQGRRSTAGAAEERAAKRAETDRTESGRTGIRFINQISIVGL